MLSRLVYDGEGRGRPQREERYGLPLLQARVPQTGWHAGGSLRRAARAAAEGKFDYFTTTLSISPLKNAGKLNEIGERLAGEYGVPYLMSDFKKKNGYKRSTELSARYGLYRQDYCGCVFSREARRGKDGDAGTEGGAADACEKACEKVDREVAD